ncbi:MAG: DUF2905 domain-containing protein [Chloroflexota bacterium]|jgi:hypothetical protein|nr:DUF2905 domain-containing protein [Chloroflexota bacterium]
MPDIGRLLMLLGSGIFILGLILVLAGRVPWLGNLPGDIRWQRGDVSVYIPLGTMLVVSVVLSLLLNLIARFWR